MGDKLIYQVKVGDASALYDLCTESVSRYCARIGADHIVQTEPILKIRPVKSSRSANALRLGYLPIFEKENAFAYLGEYEKVAVIDADVLVRGSAPDIFAEPVAAFGAVLERDMPLDGDYLAKIVKHSEGHFRPLDDVDWRWDKNGAAFYNMGVMALTDAAVPYIGDAPGDFIRRPEFERFVNGEGAWRWSTDQSLLNYWVKKSGIPALDMDWRWNCLYGAVNRSAVVEAHFVHFFLAAKTPGIEMAAAREASRG